MKYIKISEARKQAALQEFADFLSSERTINSEIKYTCKLDEVNETSVIKPKLFFTASAWLKIKLLIESYDSEIAWRGVVEKIDQENYLVSDILVYPQHVTGTTVSSDDDAYPAWCDELDDDVANNLRLQGHSHVHMATNPSGTDLAYYENILASLKKDSWFFFMIINKRGQFWVQCHDLKQNVLFETADICYTVLLDDNTTHAAWLTDVAENVKEKTFPTTKHTLSPASPQCDWDRRYVSEFLYDAYGNRNWDDETYDDTRFTGSVHTQAASTQKKGKKNNKKQAAQTTTLTRR